MRGLIFGLLLFSQFALAEDLVFCSMDSAKLILDAKQPVQCKVVSGNSTLELCDDDSGVIALPSGTVMKLSRADSDWNARTDVQDFSSNTVSSATLTLRKNAKEFFYNEKVTNDKGEVLKNFSCSGIIK